MRTPDKYDRYDATILAATRGFSTNSHALRAPARYNF
jgi:hypothetical protein